MDTSDQFNAALDSTWMEDRRTHNCTQVLEVFQQFQDLIATHSKAMYSSITCLDKDGLYVVYHTYQVAPVFRGSLARLAEWLYFREAGLSQAEMRQFRLSESPTVGPGNLTSFETSAPEMWYLQNQC